MSAPILSTHGLTKRFGGLLVTDCLDFDVLTGEVHAVIGPNGAGKTTLINQLIGELVPDGGSIEFEGRDITTLPSYRRSLLGLSRSYQITSVFPDFTALENVSLAAQAHDGQLPQGPRAPAGPAVPLGIPAATARSYGRRVLVPPAKRFQAP